MKVNVSISVDEGLRNAVADRAAREERSFSSMFSLLAQLGLDGGGPSAALEGLGALGLSRSAGLGAAEPTSGPLSAVPAVFVPVALKKTGVRTQKCVHMAPPERYCKWCDPR